MKSKLLSVLAAVLAFGLLTGLVVADIANSTGKLGPTLGGGTGGGTPGGSTTEIQFNNAGAFGGDSDFTYNSTTNTVGVGRVLASGTFTGANPQFASSVTSTDGMAFGSNTVGLYATETVQLVANGSALLTADGATGSTVLNGNAVGGANKVWLSSASGSINWEGTTADADEFVLAVGDPTEDRTLTITGGTDTTFALNAGRFDFSQPTKIGTGAWVAEAGTIALEFLVVNTGANLEGHFEGGLDTGYAGIGLRNNRRTDAGGTDLTLAGSAWLANGSASAGVKFGESVADATTLTNFGVNSRGLYIGTDTQDPLVLGVTTATGSEPRFYFEDGCFALTDAAAAASFAIVSVPSNSLTGGVINFNVYALTGANWQVRSGSVPWSAINVAGTEECTIGTEATALETTGAGTLANTWTCIDGGTNAVALQISANSSFTTPTMAICYTIYKGAGVGGITPQ